MITLQEMRDYIRSHMDLEPADLPDSLLDPWLREGSRRVERAEPRWPFYQKVITATFNPNPFLLYDLTAIAPDIDQVNSIGIEGQPPMSWIGWESLQELRSQTASVGRPRYWTRWGDFLLFYPALDTTYQTLFSYYRQPNDWVSEGAGGLPDMPTELHNTVMMWGLSRAYNQQEDPELGAVYERQFSDELNEFRRRLVVTPPMQPLIMNGGAVRRPENILVRPRFDWEVD